MLLRNNNNTVVFLINAALLKRLQSIINTHFCVTLWALIYLNYHNNQYAKKKVKAMVPTSKSNFWTY